MCGLSLLLILVLAPRSFSPGTPVFHFAEKPTTPKSTGLSVPDCLVPPWLNKVDLFYFIYRGKVWPTPPFSQQDLRIFFPRMMAESIICSVTKTDVIPFLIYST